jgi:hypothetical protein
MIAPALVIGSVVAPDAGTCPGTKRIISLRAPEVHDRGNHVA